MRITLIETTTLWDSWWLTLGVVDCIRTFTWDKMLESWVKDLTGGGRVINKPTVTSPKEYKHRFREAMERYILEAPKYVSSPPPLP